MTIEEVSALNLDQRGSMTRFSKVAGGEGEDLPFPPGTGLRYCPNHQDCIWHDLKENILQIRLIVYPQDNT